MLIKCNELSSIDIDQNTNDTVNQKQPCQHCKLMLEVVCTWNASTLWGL